MTVTRDGTMNPEVRVTVVLLTHHLEANIVFQDKLVFWGTLMLTPCVWLLFCVMNAITFAIFKTATTLICACIGAVQYWGFKNCQKAHERKMKLIAQRKGKGFFNKAS